MSIRATHSHVFQSKDILGVGATAEVFKGYTKKSGEARALKVFRWMPPGADPVYLRREVETMRQLKHRHIVTFYGLEEEVGRAGQLVLAMEYCDAGSLGLLLQEPENFFGICEDHFIRLLCHLAAGLKCMTEQGFVHRDIKPANILICSDEDGRPIFKISDFGGARPLRRDETYESLVGTDEYLHPDVYKKAFVDPRGAHQFDSYTDTWSLGATLFHAATGTTPFRPHGGARKNRNDMYRMISQKKSKAIGGVQTKENGPITWEYGLPNSCPLSESLKRQITPVIAGLLEVDRKRSLTIDTYVWEVDRIHAKFIVYVFCTRSLSLVKLYIDSKTCLPALQEEIATLTDIHASGQILLYRQSPLRISSDVPIRTMLSTSKEQPLIVISSTPVFGITLHEPCIVPYPTFGNGCVPDEYGIAVKCCAIMNITKQHIHKFSQFQEWLFQSTENISARMIDGQDTLCRLLGRSQTSLNEKGTHAFILQLNSLKILEKSEKNMPNVIESRIHQISDQINECKTCLSEAKLEENSKRISDIRNRAGLCDLDNNNCKSTSTFLFQSAKKILTEIKQRKIHADQSHYNKQLFLIEKRQLKDLCTKMHSLFQDHCWPTTRKLHEDMMLFHRSLTRNISTIKHAEITIDDLEEKLQRLESNLQMMMKAVIESRNGNNIANISTSIYSNDSLSADGSLGYSTPTQQLTNAEYIAMAERFQEASVLPSLALAPSYSSCISK